MLNKLNKVAKTVSVAFEYMAGDDDPDGVDAAIHRERISQIWHDAAASNDSKTEPSSPPPPSAG